MLSIFSLKSVTFCLINGLFSTLLLDEILLHQRFDHHSFSPHWSWIWNCILSWNNWALLVIHIILTKSTMTWIAFCLIYANNNKVKHGWLKLCSHNLHKRSLIRMIKNCKRLLFTHDYYFSLMIKSHTYAELTTENERKYVDLLISLITGQTRAQPSTIIAYRYKWYVLPVLF